MDGVPCLRVSQRHAQHFRRHLQSRQSLDLSLCVLKEPAGTVLLPIYPSCVPQLDLPTLRTLGSQSVCEVVWSLSPLHSRKKKGQRSCCDLEKTLQALVEGDGEGWTEELRRDLPRSFQRHGDLVLLGDNCFTLPQWKKCDGDLLWSAVATAVGAKRLAKMSRISRDGFRSPVVTMLLGEHSWVTHVDNGIRYEFDVTKCMFSAGNITEKLRVSQFDCRGETVVDLYAGIGYFTLPYLLHAKAQHVHACEWNPDALRALQKNLVTNGVSERCTVHPGDNRQLQLDDIADRINLGLIPSSEDGWPVACRLLKRTTGGFLHIHQNVTSPLPNAAAVPERDDAAPKGKKADREAWRAWARDAASRISCMLRDVTGAAWTTYISHVEHVKSYAPRIHHIVLDLECRPRVDDPI